MSKAIKSILKAFQNGSMPVELADEETPAISFSEAQKLIEEWHYEEYQKKFGLTAPPLNSESKGEENV